MDEPKDVGSFPQVRYGPMDLRTDGWIDKCTDGLDTVCFFWFVTLHDNIAQPPGMQTTSAMSHFVDNK